MGVFDKAKGGILARKAYQTYTAAVDLANKDQPEAAREKYHSAIAQYAEAVRLGNNSPNPMLSYALLLMREGDFEKSKAVMQEIGSQPGLADEARFQLRIQYSILLWKTGDLEEAIATVRRAAKHKMNSTVYSTLGMYLVDQARKTGDFTEAQEFNQKAVDYDDEDGDVLDNVAQMYEAMSEFEAARGEVESAAEHRAKAKSLFEKAHELRPRQVTTVYYLARMYEADGEREKAAKLLEGADKLYYSAICPISRQAMDELRATIA